jgi:hypothetical protein
MRVAVMLVVSKSILNEDAESHAMLWSPSLMMTYLVAEKVSSIE